MSLVIPGYCSRFALRLALTGVGAGLLAGCSSSERLGEAFSNPFQTSTQNTAQLGEPSPTMAPAMTAPIGAVQTRPLTPPVAGNSIISKPSQQFAAGPSMAPARSFAGWSAEGGSPIVVAQGETAEILARRYGIPVDAMIRTNGFTSASDVRPGTHLVVPVYNAALAAASGVRTPAEPAPVPQITRNTTTASLVKTPVSPPQPALAARAEKQAGMLAAAPVEKLARRSSEARVDVNSSAKGAASQKPEPLKASVAKEPVKALAVATKPEPVLAQPKKSAVVVRQEAVKIVKAETPAVEAKQPPKDAPPSASADAGTGKAVADTSNPEFRWPARGRIIQGFKPGGNDGINIAVPEGTSVKAAETGVVAYAGNELKGYGNLVLIRHPNGFVSAYANNGDIEVKRGDTVKRGQVIAKSGQSGDVASPQLHFELRKGATPVDPTQYLAGL